MPPLGLVLALGVTFGLAAQSCDVGGTGFSIDDLTDHIVVTNTSTDQTAYAHLSTSLDDRNFSLAPGLSGTLKVLAATKYTLEVYAPADPARGTYTQSLLDLRSELVDITLTPEASTGTLARAVTELSIVESALVQMHGAQMYQSCSGVLKSGVAGQATITWTSAGSSGTGVWSLNCG
jgi:hypothetical protein